MFFLIIYFSSRILLFLHSDLHEKVLVLIDWLRKNGFYFLVVCEHDNFRRNWIFSVEVSDSPNSIPNLKKRLAYFCFFQIFILTRAAGHSKFPTWSTREKITSWNNYCGLEKCYGKVIVLLEDFSTKNSMY